ncbi:MAG TPA: DUF4307 domain-containing protein [Arthrobacter sp.]|nr:DUF4307 domain-containing protein [Arthrobacter sp.]
MSATHTSSEQSSPSSLANRYGSPKRRLSRRARWILIGAALLAGVVLMGIVTITSATPKVTSKDVGFEVVDSTYATVDFRVTKDPEATAQCAVKVLNSSFAIVGWKVVTIGPTPPSEGLTSQRTTVETTSLRTESLGVSGGVDTCWIVE